MSTLGAQFEQEIFEQPSALRAFLSRQWPAVKKAADQIRPRDVKHVLFVARGSSANAARYGQFLFSTEHGLLTSLASPAWFTVYGRRPDLRGCWVIAISQSGASSDVVAVVEEARRQGVPTLALTNAAASPLKDAAAIHVPLGAGVERAVAASKTFTSEMLALACLSAAWSRRATLRAQLEAIPSWVEQVIDRDAPQCERATGLPPPRAVVARGFNLSAASEIALKLQETAAIPAIAHTAAELLHGPVAMLKEGSTTVLVAPAGKTAGDLLALGRRIKRSGSRLVVISNRKDLLSLADLGLWLPRCPEALSPFLSVVPGQLIALALARAQGLDPDHPAGLSKVTRTW